jgi:PAS domain S-box-containing protein
MGKSPDKNPETYFSSIVSELRDFAIFMMNQEGIITSWNKGCELLKGYTDDEAIGQHFEILFPDFLREEGIPYKEIEEAYRSGKYENEDWRRRKDGSLFWAFVVLTKVVDEQGIFQGFIKITQDHSKRKMLENELIKKTEVLGSTNIKLKEARDNLNKDLEGFVYTASHDLRSPISNMEGLLNIIVKHSCYQDTEIKPILDMLGESVERLKKTIGELTQISKIQNSPQDDVQDIVLAELIEEVMFSIRELMDNSHATLELDLDECPVIRFSTKNLRSIFYNLLSNSLKYRAPERSPVISIKAGKVEGYYVLIVKDNGMGIKPENQEKIYTMFRRFNDNVDGTGIGLYMVKRIVDNAGGKIEVESEVGKGTTFTLFLKS